MVAAGLIHYSFLNPGEAVTSKSCAQQIYEWKPTQTCLLLAQINKKDFFKMSVTDFTTEASESRTNRAIHLRYLPLITRLPHLQASPQDFV